MNLRGRVQIRNKEKIWQLTKGDPLYIKALFMSRYNRQKDYTIDENIDDKTYELVFRRVYQKEIEHFVPDIKADIRKTMSRSGYTKGTKEALIENGVFIVKE